jgi:hypothetical protein
VANRKHARLRHAVEQRRFAGVGVADQSHDRIRHAAAALAVQLAGALDLGKLGFDLGQSLLDHAAIGFQLGLTGTAKEAETATLTLKVGPRAHQTASLVGQVRVLDLQRAFAGARAPAENFQDQTGAIEHLGAPRPFQIALLHRRQRTVHHHDVGVMGFDQSGKLVDLAGAKVRRRPHRAEHDDARLHDLKIDGAGKADSFVETRRRRAVVGIGVRRSARRGAAHHGLDDQRTAGCRGCGISPLAVPARRRR